MTVTQVTSAVLKSGAKLDCSLVLVGVGARPNTDLFQGQLDLVQGPPGGIVVNGQLQVGGRLPPRLPAWCLGGGLQLP